MWRVEQDNRENSSLVCDNENGGCYVVANFVRNAGFLVGFEGSQAETHKLALAIAKALNRELPNGKPRKHYVAKKRDTMTEV